MRLLQARVFGNPHSSNPTSAASTEVVERARAYVLDFFNALPEEYVAIFTANATIALRHVREAYPFCAGDHFLLTFDHHNSINGNREFARAAETTHVPSIAPELRVDEDLLPCYLTDTPGDHHNLFAYPRNRTSSACNTRWNGSSDGSRVRSSGRGARSGRSSSPTVGGRPGR